MFLFIFESIGTAELVLIGLVALIFLGPRKMPEIAKKIGKIMTEFRSTTQDFKATWEREVDFENEAKAFDLDLIEKESVEEQTKAQNNEASENVIGSPVIKQIDKESFDRMAAVSATSIENSDPDESPETSETVDDSASDKRNWL